MYQLTASSAPFFLTLLIFVACHYFPHNNPRTSFNLHEHFIWNFETDTHYDQLHAFNSNNLNQMTVRSHSHSIISVTLLVFIAECQMADDASNVQERILVSTSMRSPLPWWFLSIKRCQPNQDKRAETKKKLVSLLPCICPFNWIVRSVWVLHVEFFDFIGF